MFELFNTPNEYRPPSAQEVAMRAREMEKEYYRSLAEYRTNTRVKTAKRGKRSLLELIMLMFGSLRLFS